tara:strand:- start:202 stop:501 length:300 start_codon:yes stop_codon:yes gene_type:complete
MALELSFDKFGFTADNAYHVINNIHFSKSLNEPTVPNPDGDTHVQVLTYMDKATRDADGEPMISRGFNFNFDSSSDDGIQAQAYAHLKTLDEFADATDV